MLSQQSIQLTFSGMEEVLQRLAKLERLIVTNQTGPIVYTKREAAEILKISYSTLLRRIKNGAIKTSPDGNVTHKSLIKYVDLE